MATIMIVLTSCSMVDQKLETCNVHLISLFFPRIANERMNDRKQS